MTAVGGTERVRMLTGERAEGSRGRRESTEKREQVFTLSEDVRAGGEGPGRTEHHRLLQRFWKDLRTNTMTVADNFIPPPLNLFLLNF